MESAVAVFDYLVGLSDFSEDANAFLSIYVDEAHGYPNWMARLWSPLQTFSAHRNYRGAAEDQGRIS